MAQSRFLDAKGNRIRGQVIPMGTKFQVTGTDVDPLCAGQIVQCIEDDGSPRPWFVLADNYPRGQWRAEYLYNLTALEPDQEPEGNPQKYSAANPQHYKRLTPEPAAVIEAWKLGFNLGSVISYIARCGHKDDEIQELEKAIKFLEMEIECIRRRRRVGAGEDPSILLESFR